MDDAGVYAIRAESRSPRTGCGNRTRQRRRQSTMMGALPGVTFMTRRLLLGVFLACAASTVVGARQTTSGGRMTCDRVPSIELPDVKIAEAVALPAADAGPIRAGALPRDRHDRHRDPFLPAAPRRVEWQVPYGWRRRLCRGSRESGAGIGERGLCHRRNGYRTQRFGDRRELGDEQRRAAGELRLSRRASHCGNGQGDRATLLRHARDAGVLRGLLERRPSGHDGGAALPGRFQRNRFWRARLGLRGDCRTVHQGHPGGLSRQAKPEHPGFLDRRTEVDRGTSRRQVRRGRRGERRSD